MEAGQETRGAAGGEAFQSTAWTLVIAARSDGAARRAALERLCRIYWPPVFGYLRRRGHTEADAKDITQEFFTGLLESDFLARSDPDKGRFRGYLVGALRRHLARERERQSAQKRGGNAFALAWTSDETRAHLEAIADEAPGPDEAYERSWAVSVLGRALERLRAEQTAAGRARQFAALSPCLNAGPAQGDYTGISQALGISRTQVALQVHRLNQRYVELVRREVAETVADPTEVRAEMDHLRRALAR